MKSQILKYLSILYIVFLGSGVSVFAQEDILNVSVIPPAPNASSLGEYGEVPVGMFTGTHNLSVPVYELKGKELSVPISLSYQSGGLRVNQSSSWVGLGWALNAGGAISRTMNGFPDEHGLGYLNNFTKVNVDVQTYDYTDRGFVEAVMAGTKDAEPDMFTFNFPGFSGRFVLGKDSNDEIVAYTIPHSDILIEPLNSGLSEWKITTTDGTQYYFGEKDDEDAANDGNNQYVFNTKEKTTVHTNIGLGGADVSAKEYYSSWYLTRIVSANGTDEIKFKYTKFKKLVLPRAYTHTYKTRAINDLFNEDCNMNPTSYTESDTEIEIETIILESISSDLGRVEFNLGVFNSSDWSPHLTAAYVYDPINVSPIKEFRFKYTDQIQNKFLLDSLFEVKNFGIPATEERINEYVFTYKNPQELPDVDSFARDHWGFYNGKIGNESLVPGFSECHPFFDLYDYGAKPGSDRDTDINFVDIGILTSVQYPTGGTTTFEYEPHTYSWFSVNDLFYNDDEFKDLDNEQKAIFSPAFPETSKSMEHPFTINKYQCVEIPYSITVNFSDGNKDLGTTYENTYVALYNVDDINNPVELFKFNVDDISDMSGVLGYGEGASKYLNLEAGDYKIVNKINIDPLKVNDLNSLITLIDVKYSEFPDSLIKNNYAGGLRVRRVISHDGINSDNDKIKEYIYDYNGEEYKSSGKLVSVPIYSYYSRIPKAIPVGNGGCRGTTCEYLVLSSNTILNGTVGQKNHVVYDEVTVIEGNGENGKVVNEFSFNKAFSFAKVPFVPPGENVGYSQGHLLKSTVYGPDNKILKVTKNNYTLEVEELVNVASVQGIKAKWYKQNACQPDNTSLNEFTIYYYEYNSPWYYLEYSTETNYDDNGVESYSTTYNYYRDDLKDVNIVKSIASFSSPDNEDPNGKQIITEFKYPLDYEGTNAVADKMISKHMISPAIEKFVSVKKDGVTTLLSKQKTDFKEDEHTNIVPEIISIAADGITYEPRLAYHKYDEKGHILDFSKDEGIHNSFIWGYNNTLPIAQIVNAEENQVFYQGFEEEGLAGTTDVSFLGDKAHNSSSFTISKTLVGDNLKMSYWYFDANDSKWKFSGVLDFSQTINSTGDKIDEVRVFPEGAQMTTYNYKPLVGISSVCDPNNVISYYEYDDFGRLLLIRDKDKNVLKKYEYKYHVK